MHRYLLDHSWQGVPLSAPHPEVELALNGDTVTVTIDAPARGDPAPQAPPGRLWRLWDHEVIELFVAGADERYVELELGPHGHFLFLRLDRPRHIVDDQLDLEAYAARVEAGRWRGQARLARSCLPSPPWRFNLYAIHGAPPRREHRALFALPGTAPDFHQPSAFGPWPLAPHVKGTPSTPLP